TAKMGGPACTFKDLAQRAGVNRDDVARAAGIDRIGIRQEYDVDAGFGAHSKIGIQGARVDIEVFIGRKLRGVDENRSHEEIAQRTRVPQQFLVAGMQRTHGRDKRHRAGGVGGFAQFAAAGDDGWCAHRNASTIPAMASQSASWRTPRTSWAVSAVSRPASSARCDVARAIAKYAATVSSSIPGSTSASACARSVVRPRRATGPVNGASLRVGEFSSAAVSGGRKTAAGSSAPIRLSRSIAWAISVTRWFAPCARAAW